MFICRENRAFNQLGFFCATHGDVLKPLGLDAFYVLQMAGVPVRYFTVDEVHEDHLAQVREFADRLDDVLEQILGAA